MKIFKNKDRDSLTLKFENATVNIEEKQDNEYIWVDGFKGLDKNMQGYGNFQYELGKTYVCEKEPELCRNGFHFCLNLRDTYKYYQPCDGNRFFKVSAFVKKEHYKRYGQYSFGAYLNKLAAKEIKLIEELSDEELFEAWEFKDCDFIGSIEDFSFVRNNKPDKNCWIDNKLISILKGKYSNLFSVVLIEREKLIQNKILVVKKALALYEEGVSPDMRAYLLLKN